VFKRLLDIFSLHTRRNGYLGSFRSKIWLRHWLQQPWFSIRRVYCRYPMTFTAYIWCFVHNFICPCDLDFWPFHLGSVWWIKSLTHPTHIPIFSTQRVSIPELCVTQSDHITITWNGHCACAVTRDLSPGGGGAKMIHIFEIFDPNLPIHVVTFRELRRRLSYVVC